MYIQLNGQVIYYEKTGEGSPIILAHGNGETHKIFDILIPELSRKHTVSALQFCTALATAASRVLSAPADIPACFPPLW